MTVWLQVWWILLHGLFSQMVYPFPGLRPLVSIPLNGMLVWWEADVGSNCSGACTDGASQSTWADQSGNGNNGVLNAYLSAMPCVASVYHTNQINGKPAVTFNGNTTDGSDTCFQVSNAGLDNKTTATVALVFKNGSGLFRAYMGGSSNSLVGGLGDSGNALQEIQQGSTANIGNGTARGDTNWHQINVTYNSSTGAFAFRTDRAADNSGTNAKTISSNWIALGVTYAGGSISTFSGQIAEFIMYNRVLSGGEITTVETYINGKYGL